eukprot:4413955-Pleurochrysis_carterae.AAC.1
MSVRQRASQRTRKCQRVRVKARARGQKAHNAKRQWKQCNEHFKPCSSVKSTVPCPLWALLPH